MGAIIPKQKDVRELICKVRIPRSRLLRGLFFTENAEASKTANWLTLPEEACPKWKRLGKHIRSNFSRPVYSKGECALAVRDLPYRFQGRDWSNCVCLAVKLPCELDACT